MYNLSYKCYKSQVYTDYCLQSPQTVSEHAATNIVLTVRNHELWDRKLNEVERQSSWERSTFELSSVQHINGVGKRSSSSLWDCNVICTAVFGLRFMIVAELTVHSGVITQTPNTRRSKCVFKCLHSHWFSSVIHLCGDHSTHIFNAKWLLQPANNTQAAFNQVSNFVTA